MDIEFHYYMTYLIAARAGFEPSDATIVAQSAQEIDDNHIPIKAGAGTPEEYTGTISQTMDILRPRHSERIYPIFHFIPGEPDAPSALRADGMRNAWVTTPNSPLANEMLDTALKSQNLYRIGASSHAYADTWAHQNFVGREDVFNEMPSDGSIVERIVDEVTVLRIGHALAKHKPDIPDLIWIDGRLMNSTVVNAERFLDAARHLFAKFRRHVRGAEPYEEETASLLADLRADIGPPCATSAPCEERIGRYSRRALTAPYGGTRIPEYQEGKWSDAAFVEKRGDLSTEFAEFIEKYSGIAGDILDFGTKMHVTWKDPMRREETNWFKFQEAVKSHLDECWGVLAERFPEVLQS